jgi:hypothetical protein
VRSSHFSGVRRFASLVLALALLGWGAASGLGGWWISEGRFESGVMLLVVAGASLLAVALLFCQIVLLHKVANNSFREYEALLDVNDLLRRQGEHWRTVAENSALSDWAKKIVFREKDHEFLRDSIQGAIIRQDWEAADHLIRALDEEFGYRQEADQFRAQVQEARDATIEERVIAAVERVEALCAARKWDQAQREARRLADIFPSHERIAALLSDVEQRRRAYKTELLTRYDQAVRRHDVDGAHELLIELDRFLSPNEAAALRESARGVFKAKLLQLGVRFSLAVSDHQFAQAVEVGQTVIREFPNSRYAQEIRSMLPALRRRAAEGSPVHEPAQSA